VAARSPSLALRDKCDRSFWPPSTGEAVDELFDRLERDEPPAAKLDGLELPVGNQLIRTGPADAEFSNVTCLIDNRRGMRGRERVRTRIGHYPSVTLAEARKHAHKLLGQEPEKKSALTFERARAKFFERDRRSAESVASSSGAIRRLSGTNLKQ
jgi:hypothetical protein